MALSLNMQKEKGWLNVIKQEAKLKGWKYREYFAYKTVNDLFCKISFYTVGSKDYVYGSLCLKPLIIDNVFWEITGLEENERMPVSIRANGAFVLDAKGVHDYKLQIVPETLKADIDNLFNSINLMVDEFSSNIKNINDFVKFLERDSRERSECPDFDLLIVSSIIQKNYTKALSLLSDARENNRICRWGFGDKNFYDLAIEHCQSYQ